MKLETNQLSTSLLTIAKRVSRYRVLLFVVLVAVLYAYLALQINKATSVAPTPAEQLTSVKPSPRIDPSLVQKLRQLQDNSVSVKALFNEGRTNPFE